MIVGLRNAILHILDAVSGITVYSDECLDIESAEINNFITKHIEKLYESAALRPAEFKEASGFKAKIREYANGDITFENMSRNAVERLCEAYSAEAEPCSCDIIVCGFVTNDKNMIGILKCDNSIGMTHTIVQDGGRVLNNIINHYAILPPVSRKIAECAFVDINSEEIRYAGKKHKIDGETVDIFSELLLECEYEISPRESANTVTRTAKKVALENGVDSIEAAAKIKEYVTKSIEKNAYEFIDTDAVADAVFDGLPSMREEFAEKLEKAGVPKQVEVNQYITKKMTSNVKISTDTGVELSFPPEYYRNPDYMEIITNEDGTLSIKLNNIKELR